MEYAESSRDDSANMDKLIEERKLSARKACQIVGCHLVDFIDFPDNRLDSIALLDVIKKVEYFLDLYSPSKVFTHYKDDLNIDHRIVNNAVVTACRPQKDLCVKELMFFEVPSSTEYSLSETFSPNYFVDISTTIDLKIHAINIYQSEMRDFPHPRSVKAINSLASWRGSSSGFEYAESFIIGRLLY